MLNPLVDRVAPMVPRQALLDTLCDRLHPEWVTISLRFSMWQKVAAFAPLLLLAVSLPGEVLLRCRMDGLLRASCCCPADPADDGTPSPVPVVKAQGCCDREAATNQPTAVKADRRSSVDSAGVTIVALAASPDLAVDEIGRARPAPHDSHGPPRHGPSIVLLKHAFLI